MPFITKEGEYDYMKPVYKDGGLLYSYTAEIYRDGEVVIRHRFGGSTVEFNIGDVEYITLSYGGWGKSKVIINSKGVTLGTTKGLPVKQAHDLRSWLRLQRRRFDDED